jgi:putative membrane protein
MKGQPIDWSVPQRQSPAAVFIVITKVLLDVLKFAWPLVLLYIFRSSPKKENNWELILLGLSGITIIGALIELLFFRFSIVNNELVIKKGLFIRKVIVLPLEKIQAVHIDRTWIHNLFKTARVSFDSAGSEKIEIKISAIELEKAQILKEFIAGAGQIATDHASKPLDETIISLNTRDLLKLSISANHLEAFFILLAFGFSAFDGIEKVAGETKGFLQWSLDFAQSRSANVVSILIAAILMIAVLISVVRILLLYLDFRISRSEKGFHIRTGMINVREKLVPFRKIQFISWKANWLRHKMKLYLLNFHATGSDLVKQKQQIKVPVTRNEFIPRLVQYYHSLLPVEELTPLRIQKVYVFRRILLAGFLPAIFLVCIGFLFFQYYSLLFLLIIPLTALHSWLFQKKFRLWADREAIQIKKGIYGVEELILKWNNIQKTKLQQSHYQRRRQLATIKIYTAGGVIVIPYIVYQQALHIMNYALYKVESDTTPWM